MTVEEFQAACDAAVEYVREHIVPNPKTRNKRNSKGRLIGSTGNMARHGLQREYLDNGWTCRVWMDEEEVPYVIYTDEPWTAPRWHGKKNPNEGWWDKAVKVLVDKIAENLNGEVQ